jgi:putative SOS response-associated peptidase YedK
MCGRYLLSVDIGEILQHYGIIKGWYGNNWATVWTPEVFPSHTVPIVRNRGTREVVPMKWGFASPYRKGLIINSRGETVDSKPMFRRAFRQKRCLVPANAFFEWSKLGKSSTKHRIQVRQLSIFSMAGIYEDFFDKDGRPYTAFSIITTSPNHLVSQVHDRMPVILSREGEDIWLDNNIKDYSRLKDLLRPYEDGEMSIEQV